MAGSRPPGPLGFTETHDSIDDGTLIRTRSAMRGPLGNNPPLRRITLPQARSGQSSNLNHNIGSSIAEWTLQQKFTAALQLTLPKLPISMRHEFAALISPASIGVMVGTLVVWAGSHAFGIGEIIDIVLLLAGVMFVGFAVRDVAEHLSAFIRLTYAAKTQRELEGAASHLAQVIAIIGVAAFAAVLTKGARRINRAPAPSTAKQPPPIKEPAPKIIKRIPSQEGLHNQRELKPDVQRGSFKTVRKVDMENLSPSDAAVAKALKEQGRDAKTIQQILSSGDNFQAHTLKPGDKLYGFTSNDFPKAGNSPYWLDEAGYKDVQSKFSKDGVWDKEGLKGYLALPCYNTAQALDVTEVTREQTVVKSTIGKATELLQYKSADGGSTELMGKIMGGGGTQISPDPSAIGNITRIGKGL